MDKKTYRAIIFGDYANAPYHPLKDIDNLLKDLLSDEMTVTCTEDRSMLELENLKNYDLCISYLDAWDKNLTTVQMGGLLAFVAQGGGFLPIHSGVSYQLNPDYPQNPELMQMIGARFTGHPPYQRLNYKTKDVSHPIIEGIKNFEMDEELYMFEFDDFDRSTILMECSNDSILMPAAWVHSYGLGRVAYLAPGHNLGSFQHPEFQKLIRKSALWAVKAI